MRRLLTIGSLLFLGMLACLAEYERDLCLSACQQDYAHLPTIELVINIAPEYPLVVHVQRIPVHQAPDPSDDSNRIVSIQRHLLHRYASYARQQLKTATPENMQGVRLLSVLHCTNAWHQSSEDDPPLRA